MRTNKILVGCVAAGLVLTANAREKATETATGFDRSPNIIYILADDLGIGDISPYGQKLIKTPNLDRMASEGMRFSQCYAGTAVSAPSRASLMTGLHTGHTHIRGNLRVDPEGQVAMPEVEITPYMECKVMRLTNEPLFISIDTVISRDMIICGKSKMQKL